MVKVVDSSYVVDNVRYCCCSKCGREVGGIGEETVAVVCSHCTVRMIPLEETKSAYKPTGRPPGWHWMAEFVDKDGNVFHRGKEQPKLKGTLKPTKVSPPKKKVKRRSKEQMLVARHKEKKAALKEAIKKQQDFINHNIDKGK
jgi:hypothetical protein